MSPTEVIATLRRMRDSRYLAERNFRPAVGQSNYSVAADTADLREEQEALSLAIRALERLAGKPEVSRG